MRVDNDGTSTVTIHGPTDLCAKCSPPSTPTQTRDCQRRRRPRSPPLRRRPHHRPPAPQPRPRHRTGDHDRDPSRSPPPADGRRRARSDRVPIRAHGLPISRAAYDRLRCDAAIAVERALDDGTIERTPTPTRSLDGSATRYTPATSAAAAGPAATHAPRSTSTTSSGDPVRAQRDRQHRLALPLPPPLHPPSRLAHRRQRERHTHIHRPHRPNRRRTHRSPPTTPHDALRTRKPNAASPPTPPRSPPHSATASTATGPSAPSATTTKSTTAATDEKRSRGTAFSHPAAHLLELVDGHEHRAGLGALRSGRRCPAARAGP